MVLNDGVNVMTLVAPVTKKAAPKKAAPKKKAKAADPAPNPDANSTPTEE